MRALNALTMKLAATSIRNSATMPPAEYHKTSLLRFMSLPCPLVADDHPGGEKGEAHHRDEENQVAGVQHAALETVERRHDRERGDHLRHDRIGETRQQIGDRGVAGEDQEETDHDRQDE